LKINLVGWKGKNSVRAYVPKNERIHYLRLIGADTTKYEKNKFEAKREIEKKEEEEKAVPNTEGAKEQQVPATTE
jgi:tRNA (cytosine34-C5)-methyltransferase